MAEEATQTLVPVELAERVIARALKNGGDIAEVFCEERAGRGFQIDESRVERAQTGAERGAGVRVVSGDTTYFAHVDGLAAVVVAERFNLSSLMTFDMRSVLRDLALQGAAG